MFIEYVSHEKINFKKWDTCIKNAPNGNIYAWSWYLNCLGHWDALIAEDYQYCFPLFSNSKLFGIRQIYQPLFCQQLGLFSSESITETILDSFLQKLLKYKFVQLNLNESNSKLAVPYPYTNRQNHLLPLSHSYEDIRSNYSKSLRKRLKKAKDKHKSIEQVLSVETLIDFYKKNVGHKTKIKDYSNIRNIITMSSKNLMGFALQLKTATNEIGAMGFFGRSHNRIYNLFGASSPLGKKNHSMHLLLDSIIQMNAGTTQVLDFEGSSIPNIAHFFERFGAKPQSYSSLKINQLPYPIKWLKNA